MFSDWRRPENPRPPLQPAQPRAAPHLEPIPLSRIRRDQISESARTLPPKSRRLTAVQSAKERALRSRDVDLATGLRMEQMMLRLLQTSNDVVEGTTAFAQKRAPSFKGN